MGFSGTPWKSRAQWAQTPMRGASAPAWTPAQLTGVRGWYKSDAGVTIVTGVSQWADQSAAGNHLVQATGANQPALTASQINGLPALTFDGSNDFLRVAFTMTTPWTVFLVMRQVTWVSGRFIVDGASASVACLTQSTASPGLGMTAGSTIGPNNNAVVGTFASITCIFNVASSVLQVNSTAATTGDTGSNAPSGFTIGGRQNGTSLANVQVAEAAVMAAVASTQERTDWRTYVTARYGFAA